MGLDLAHGWNVPLRDLVMVLHIVLQGLVVIVLHLLACNASDLGELVRLVISLGHSDLVLGVES